MFLYVGAYWADFPESEYGGMWVVMAENENQAVELLKEVDYYPDDARVEKIRQAVQKGDVFQLDDNVHSHQEPKVMACMFT